MQSWKASLVSATLIAGALGVAPIGFGHGGNECGGGYSPFPSPVPEPPPPPPPAAPAPQPKLPPLGGPTTTKPSGAPASTPTSGGAITGSGSAASRRSATTASLDRWECWWEANEERWLLAPSTRSGPTSAAGAIGGAGARPPRLRGPDADALRTRALPQLLTLLAARESNVADAAALALGQLVRPEQANLALLPLTRALDHAQPTVRESAALALGIVGSPDALPTLRELLHDTTKGRELTSHPAGVEERVRCFAAAAIGLIGAPEGFDDLRRIVEEPRFVRNVELQQLALISLGLLRGAQEQVVPCLLRQLERRDLDRIVRAQVPTALSRLAGDPMGASAARAALSRLVALAADEKAETDLRRSAVIALGRIARAEDAEVLAALAAVVERGNDASARHFALIALAEIGGADDRPAANAAAHARIEALLVREVESPRRGEHRPFAALGLGIWSRNPELGAEVQARTGERLADQFEACRQASHRGALAIGLGLSGAVASAAPVVSAFDATKDPTQKSYLALALGLLRATSEAPRLLAELDKARLAPSLEVRLARALTLLGADAATARLVDRLRRADTSVEVEHTALAVALTGDGAALEHLVAVAADESVPAAWRGVAAESLGVLATASELPWNAVFELDTNYLIRTPALAQLVMLF